MRLKPYWAIDISTIKPDHRDLISFCDTTQLELQSWQVSLAYVFLFQNDSTANLRDCPISRVMRNSLSPHADKINRYNSYPCRQTFKNVFLVRKPGAKSLNFWSRLELEVLLAAILDLDGWKSRENVSKWCRKVIITNANKTA